MIDGKMKKINIYLAGPSKEYEYRRKALEICYYLNQQDLGDIIPYDPMSIEEQLNKPTAEYIVNLDVNKIKESDIVVAYISKITPGTMMELVYSKVNNIPVYAIVNPKVKREDTGKSFNEDPWIQYHVTEFFEDIEGCLEATYIKHVVSK